MCSCKCLHNQASEQVTATIRLPWRASIPSQWRMGGGQESGSRRAQFGKRLCNKQKEHCMHHTRQLMPVPSNGFPCRAYYFIIKLASDSL